MAKRTKLRKKPIDPAMVEAGQRLRDKRIAKKIDRGLMAHLITVDPKTIDNYETGATRATGAVEFAYDNIDLLIETRLGRRTSTWRYSTGSQDPLPFDEDVVIDLRDHVVAQMHQNDSFAPLANAS